MREKEGRLLPDQREQFIEVVGRRGAGAGGDPEVGGYLVEQTVVRVVDQLVVLALLDLLDGQAQLLADLVVREVVDVGDPRLNLQHGGHGIEHVLARVRRVVHEAFRQGGGVVGGAALDTVGDDFRAVSDPVDAVRAGFHRLPGQEIGQPPGRDR